MKKKKKVWVGWVAENKNVFRWSKDDGDVWLELNVHGIWKYKGTDDKEHKIRITVEEL